MSLPPASKSSDLRLLVLGISNPINEDANGTGSSLNPVTNSSLFPAFLTALTNTEPSADVTSFAGYTTHPPLAINNKYYAANITIWCDELSPPTDAQASEWSENMRSDEAREVREVIGGIVLLLPYSETKSDMLDTYCKLLADVSSIRELIEDDTGRDIATIAVIQDRTPKATAERKSNLKLPVFTQNLEDACLSDHGIFGWDIVHWQPTSGDAGVDEYGEKQGMPRILEVLEQTDWSASISTSDEAGYELASIDDFLDDMGPLDIKPNVRPLRDPVSDQSDEFQREIMGLHFALEDQSRKEISEIESGDELEVDQMMSLMSRATEIREEGTTMSKEDREKFARKEVARLMREMRLG